MSEALRLADLVEHDPLAYSDDAAAELRRLSAELAALKAAIEAQVVQAFRTSFAYDVGFKDGQQAAKKSDGCGRCTDAIEAQATVVQQGPVAWMWKNTKTDAEGVYLEDPATIGIELNHPAYQWTLLYTHPAQQAKPKPITEQELKAGREAVTDDPDEQPDPWSFRMGAWFAERHHGIKE